MSDSAVRYVVTGRVQGVGFRWFVMREASRLDLAGFVRNLSDGTVEVVARGPSQALTALERKLAVGPSGAHVHGVDKAEVSQYIDLVKPFGVM